MQYELPKVSKLAIRSDYPTAVSSTQYGANLDAYGFNAEFIARRDPALAVKLVKLWHQANNLSSEAPLVPGEDYALAEAELRGLVDMPQL
ncbi:MAG TPA: hypothetical protein VHX38_23880 [Pseudonocardiaceae bacterium]|jgi:hypothetical protein|nr:hypothetical protein [Pseudonocardiaceae bacterium]